MRSRNDHQRNNTVLSQAAFNEALFRPTLLNNRDRAMRAAHEFIATDSVGGVPKF